MEKEKSNIIDAIKAGIPVSQLKEALEVTTNKIAEIDRRLALKEQNMPVISDEIAVRYREQLANLKSVLKDNPQCKEARETVHPLINKIVLTPTENDIGYQIDLYGNLAEILKIAAGGDNGEKILGKIKTNKEENRPDKSVKLVAGAGLHQNTLRGVLTLRARCARG